jgi:hypothetical protein
MMMVTVITIDLPHQSKCDVANVSEVRLTSLSTAVVIVAECEVWKAGMSSHISKQAII